MARASKPTKRNAKIHSLVKNYVNQSTQHVRTQGKGKARAIDDVYEYAPSKVRRANVKLDLDRHETDGRRGGLDDELDIAGLGPEATQKLRARLLMEDDDGGRVDSEDDEDINSDNAFEETDKEDFAGSGFTRKSSKSKSKASRKRRTKSTPRDVDLNEDSDVQLSAGGSQATEDEDDEDDEDEDMEEGGSGDFFDVLDMFDGRAEVGDEDAQLPKVEKKKREAQSKVTEETGEDEDEEEEWMGTGNSDVDSEVGMDEDEDGEDVEEDVEEDEDEDEEDLHISASDSEDPSPEALADLESFLSKLDPSESLKRKTDDASSLEPTTKKRRMLAELTEAGEEGEFGVRGSGMLKLDDLLAPLASSSSSLVSLKKSTKALTSSSTKTKTLSAPLPQRAQERLDREAAYEQTKEEVDKWSATMKRIKEAEHLSFPLQAEKPSRVSNLELAAKFTPSNELESAVDKLLKSAQLRDEDIAHTEALKMAHLSVEEVAARRAELRMMRELAFRADRKAKQIAKIKSKTYRRIRKKQRERLDGVDNGGDVDVEDEGERLKAEVERARERATLRHKNMGKWAKAMHDRGELDQDQRQAISEMLERGEKLRRRIRGEESGDEDNEDSESDEEELDEEGVKRGAFEELAALRAEDDTGVPDLESKSVFNMKFMRDAAARQAQQADAQADELARELGFKVDGDDDDDETNTTPPSEATMVQRTGGRLLFRPGATSVPLRPLGSLASDTSSVTLQSADLMQDVHPPETTPTPSLSTPTPTSSAPVTNPWLVHTESSGPSRKRNEVRVSKGADASTKASSKLKKQAGKTEEERERARDDAVLEIDTDNVLTIPDPPAPAQSTSGNTKAKGKAKAGVPKGSSAPANGGDDDESDAHSELEEQERAVEKKNAPGAGKGVQAFQQRDLVALAFAGDNVVQTFEEAKRQEMEADAPHEVDTTLPGWGSWGGSGTKKQPPKPHLIKKVAGVDPTSRADYKKAHVIISEKRDKKAAKYLVKDLPFPYTSHAQFERSMDTPLGTEWNTRVGFQRGTLPRVVKKMGTVIDPLEKLF